MYCINPIKKLLWFKPCDFHCISLEFNNSKCADRPACGCETSQYREQTEGHTSPQGSWVKRSHTSCSLRRRTPADCFTGSLIVQIYHPCHWCGLSQRPLKTKEHHPKPDVAPNKVLGEGCHCSIQSAWKTDGLTNKVSGVTGRHKALRQMKGSVQVWYIPAMVSIWTSAFFISGILYGIL